MSIFASSVVNPRSRGGLDDGDDGGDNDGD